MNNRREAAAAILAEWGIIQSQLVPKFRARDQKDTKEWMEKGINLFLEFLYLTNHETFLSSNEISYDQFLYKPVNLEERIDFINSRPGLYHSYRQLSELMLEQEKQFVKSNIIKKSPRSLT
ncbi:YpoC family protein [Neobacillus vireti]|uniref:YpoC family protein n=1 Tax=Neobacillus vireti TaxID=220686 RepID=UPI002FFDEBBD